MTITDRPPPAMPPTTDSAATGRVPMTPLRRTALVAGVLYLLSFVSIPAPFILYSSVRARNYVLGSGPDTAAIIGGVLEMVVALAGIGTAVALYPVLKRQHEGVALGFVGSRTLEGAGIVVGVACLLAVVNLRQAGAGTGAVAAGQALVAFYGVIFLLSQSLMPAFNALLLGSLLFRSRLVPRWLPVLGFAGAALLLVAFAVSLAHPGRQVSTLTGSLALPIAVWEFSLGVYLIVKGFKPSPVTAGMSAGIRPAHQDAVQL